LGRSFNLGLKANPSWIDFKLIIFIVIINSRIIVLVITIIKEIAQIVITGCNELNKRKLVFYLIRIKIKVKV